MVGLVVAIRLEELESILEMSISWRTWSVRLFPTNSSFIKSVKTRVASSPRQMQASVPIFLASNETTLCKIKKTNLIQSRGFSDNRSQSTLVFKTQPLILARLTRIRSFSPKVNSTLLQWLPTRGTSTSHWYSLHWWSTNFCQTQTRPTYSQKTLQGATTSPISTWTPIWVRTSKLFRGTSGLKARSAPHL